MEGCRQGVDDKLLRAGRQLAEQCVLQAGRLLSGCMPTGHGVQAAEMSGNEGDQQGCHRNAQKASRSAGVHREFPDG